MTVICPSAPLESDLLVLYKLDDDYYYNMSEISHLYSLFFFIK